VTAAPVFRGPTPGLPVIIVSSQVDTSTNLSGRLSPPSIRLAVSAAG